MSHAISEELMLIINLKHAAIHHKRYCDINCNVSVMQLRLAAVNLARWVYTWEKAEAQQHIEEMPLT